MKVLPRFLTDSAVAFLILFSTFCFGAVFPWASWGLTGGLFLLAAIHPPALKDFQNIPYFSRVAFAGVFLLIILQICCTSRAPQLTFEEFLHWLSLFFLFCLVQKFPEKSLRRLVILTSFWGLLLAVYGGYEVISGRESILWLTKKNYTGFVTGTYFNRNHFAGVLELLLGGQLGLLFEALLQRKKKKIVTCAAVFVITAVLFLLTGSRMGIVSFTAALFLLAILQAPGNKDIQKFCIICVLILGVSALLLRESVLTRFLDVETWESSGKGRVWVWQGTFKMIQHYFWTGSGLGTYEWIFPAFQPARSMLSYPHAHQDYLELAAVLGVPAALMLFFAFASLFLKIIGGLKKERSPFSALGWGVMLGLISFLIHSLADFNLAIPANRFLFIFFTAAAARLSLRDKI